MINQCLGEMCYYIGLHFKFSCIDIQYNKKKQKKTDNEEDTNRNINRYELKLYEIYFFSKYLFNNCF